MKIAKMIVGLFGLIGVLMCGSSVVVWTLKLGTLPNFIGAVLITILCACSGVSCMYLIKEGKNG